MNDLEDYWEDSWISEGDTLLVHSSMKRVFREMIRRKIEPKSKIIIDSLLNMLGKNGTLVFPLFNFDFPKDKYFSMTSTPSQMGKITEDARNLYKGVRTGHPVYSFFAIGKNAQEFAGINNKSAYALDSPFGKLIEMDAKIAVVDLDDQDSMTLYHHVEEINRVGYRYFKDFTGMYEDTGGVVCEKTYSIFVRNLEMRVETDVNRMGELLWTQRIYKGNRPGQGNGMRIAKAREIYNATERQILDGRALEFLYSINI